MTRSRNHSCRGNGTVPSPFIAVGVAVAVKNIKVFIVATIRQQWDLFALLSSYKLLRTAVKNNKDYTLSAGFYVLALVIPHVNSVYLHRVTRCYVVCLHVTSGSLSPCHGVSTGCGWRSGLLYVG